MLAALVRHPELKGTLEGTMHFGPYNTILGGSWDLVSTATGILTGVTSNYKCRNLNRSY